MKKNSWKIWQHHDTERQELLRPGRDWRVMLAIILLSFVALFAAHTWIKDGLKNFSHSEATITDSDITARFTKEELAKYANDLETHQAKFDSLQAKPETFADPSL